MFEHGLREPGSALAGVETNHGAAHHDGAMEEAVRGRRREQRAHLPAAARLPEDRDVPGVASEAFDVVPHPLQRGDHVERAGVARLGEFLSADVGKMQVAEDVQALVDRHHHDVVERGEVGPVEPRRVG